MLEAFKKSAGDDIDVKRLEIPTRQLTARNAEANENRAARENLMQQQNSIAESRRQILNATPHTKQQLDDCDAQLRECSELINRIDARYRELSEEMKPIIMLRNECRDFILKSGLQLPGKIRGNLVTAPSGKGPAAGTLADYHKLRDKRGNLFREIQRVENLPPDPEEIIAAWNKTVDDLGA